MSLLVIPIPDLVKLRVNYCTNVPPKQQRVKPKPKLSFSYFFPLVIPPNLLNLMVIGMTWGYLDFLAVLKG